ncbi:hypothetical protein BH10BAC5_BH10BAC5_09920 [soil metagenome]
MIRSSNSGGDFFVEGMDDNANGNIGYQTTLGSYKDNFSNPDDLQYHYVYDKSNRLVQADALERGVDEHNFDLYTTYDHDGNILKLTRYEDEKTPSDDFSMTTHYKKTRYLSRVNLQHWFNSLLSLFTNLMEV